MPEKLVVLKESLPNRCDICHQTDLFNSQLNYCERCKCASDFLEKELVNTDFPYNSKDAPRVRVMLGISLSIGSGILIWKVLLWRVIKWMVTILNINISGTDYFLLNQLSSIFFLLILGCIGWKIGRSSHQLSIKTMLNTLFTLFLTILFWITTDTIIYAKAHTISFLLRISFEIASILAGVIVGSVVVPLLMDKYVLIKKVKS